MPVRVLVSDATEKWDLSKQSQSCLARRHPTVSEDTHLRWPPAPAGIIQSKVTFSQQFLGADSMTYSPVVGFEAAYFPRLQTWCASLFGLTWRPGVCSQRSMPFAASSEAVTSVINLNPSESSFFRFVEWLSEPGCHRKPRGVRQDIHRSQSG